MNKTVRLLLLALGVSLAAYLISRHTGAITESLGRVGWGGMLLYLAASLVSHLVHTAAWRLAFTPDQPPVGFVRLLGLRLAGEAVNKVTPLASLGGEPVKAYLLTRDGLSLTSAIASVAIAKNVMTLAQIGFIFLGVALALPVWPGKTALLLALAAFPGFVLLGVIVTLTLDHRLRRRKTVLPGSVSTSTERDTATTPSFVQTGPPLSRWRKGIQAMARVWSQVADFFWARPEVCLGCLALYFLGWAAGALEILVGSHALGAPLSVREAVIMEGLLQSVGMASFFIPANAGAQEGGYALLSPLVGLSTPTGVTLAILRRCRDFLWVGLGLAFLAVTEGRVLLGTRLEVTEGAQ